MSDPYDPNLELNPNMLTIGAVVLFIFGLATVGAIWKMSEEKTSGAPTSSQ